MKGVSSTIHPFLFGSLPDGDNFRSCYAQGLHLIFETTSLFLKLKGIQNNKPSTIAEGLPFMITFH